MTSHATASFSVASWDEQPIEPNEGSAKVTRAHVTTNYQGDLSGSSALEYLMVYRDGDAAARFIGFERFTGSLHGKTGNFVLELRGEFADGLASAHSSVVPGSGRGELAGLRGEGGFAARHGAQETDATLDYDLD